MDPTLLLRLHLAASCPGQVEGVDSAKARIAGAHDQVAGPMPQALLPRTQKVWPEQPVLAAV